ncbi:alpha/beta hydrolase family protein [Pedobacter ginsengisoli]|uniref:alpha/beta hydrolase family protein n=1 Tax=Pedobacter ginsengisoli TaxID=363852 RepID=UPI00254F2C83|nr:prolyl oligopeptidase family serine peptidase [Pedobacter ginsengisoli]
MKLLKSHYTFILTLLFVCSATAQKKVIDETAYRNWPSVGYAAITNNGKYVCYTIENKTSSKNALVLKSIDNRWEKNISGVIGFSSISKDGKYAVCLNQKDSLVIVTLGKDQIRSLPNVASFRMFKSEGGDWIFYKLTNSNKELGIYNLITAKEQIHHGIIEYILGDDGHTLVLQIERKINKTISQEIKWLDLNTGKCDLIWQGLEANSIILDSEHNQLAFISKDSLFHYNRNTERTTCLINQENIEIKSDLTLGGIDRFSINGDKLFIKLREESKPKPVSDAVEIWSYLDYKLQSQQKEELGLKSYAAVVDLSKRKILRLEQQFENAQFNDHPNQSDTIGIVTYQKSDGRSGEVEWNLAGRISYSLVSVKTGKRTKIEYSPTISPKGKFAVYFDIKRKCFVSYNIKTGVPKNISMQMMEFLKRTSIHKGIECGIVGWLANEEAVLLNDGYDIWNLDLLGLRPPINLTNGVGRKSNIVFSIVYDHYNDRTFERKNRLILSAFDLGSKKNGFYYIKQLDKQNDPEILTMEPRIFITNSAYVPSNVDMAPIKAKNANIYIVRRMSAFEAPNFFSTMDFKSFKRLSILHPEKEYNWYTTELHSWKSLDGRTLQGILYKPEDFNPNKKYPVIFHYYERKSDGLNAFIKPEPLCDGCTINIPSYVSNGYLVFTPDIYYNTGNPMKGTFDAVVSAAEYVRAMPFVNPRQLGLQGCSFGAIQTNYLIAHSNLFAAACSSSGIADWVSNYGRIGIGGSSLQGFTETGQLRMGTTLWESPDRYIKTSPIFYLNRIETPLLIMHTKNDNICAFDDAIELFSGLRRLGKKAWMLAYSQGNHGLRGEEARDFSVRMMQFFDHYLRNKAAPVWMLDGIPASRRGLDDGLSLDDRQRVPGPGLLIPEEQRKMDSIVVKNNHDNF